MVKSLINPKSITYVEDKNVRVADLTSPLISPLYKVTLQGVICVICIGRRNTDYENQNDGGVIHWPIYLITKKKTASNVIGVKKVHGCIGLFESSVESSQAGVELPNISTLGTPLLFNFATKNYFKKQDLYFGDKDDGDELSPDAEIDNLDLDRSSQDKDVEVEKEFSVDDLNEKVWINKYLPDLGENNMVYAEDDMMEGENMAKLLKIIRDAVGQRDKPVDVDDTLALLSQKTNFVAILKTYQNFVKRRIKIIENMNQNLSTKTEAIKELKSKIEQMAENQSEESENAEATLEELKSKRAEDERELREAMDEKDNIQNRLLQSSMYKNCNKLTNFFKSNSKSKDKDKSKGRGKGKSIKQIGISFVDQLGEYLVDPLMVKVMSLLFRVNIVIVSQAASKESPDDNPVVCLDDKADPDIENLLKELYRVTGVETSTFEEYLFVDKVDESKYKLLGLLVKGATEDQNRTVLSPPLRLLGGDESAMGRYLCVPSKEGDTADM